MPGIAETIDRLRAARTVNPLGPKDSGRLQPLTSFGSNPGGLDGWCFAPTAAGEGFALVVVLHGCTQTARGYDAGAGWSDLGEKHGFAVLCPEQRRENNGNLCFNWFEAGDTRRGGGEVESIRQMIAAMLDRHPIDPARVFITGLSAGGAMASAMLATYPELFACGGIVAGLPHGAAGSVTQALERMRGQGHPAGDAYADRVRAASPHTGRWPSISVWHGTADHTVHSANAEHIVAQWAPLHGAGAAPDRTETVDGQQRRVWLDRAGNEAIEAYSVAGMGHGTPLRTGGPDGCGAAGPHMIEAGISSTRHLAAKWGLLTAAPADRKPAPHAPAPVAPARMQAVPSSVQSVIEGALRTAGLMK